MKKHTLWGKKIAIGILLLIVVLAVAGWLITARDKSVTKKTWNGVDETVIEKSAADAGREAKKPLIDTDKGDLLLFVFALGGAAGGFAAGYYWRKLISDKAERSDGS